MCYDKMDTTRKSVATLTFLLAFFIISSDMCKKLEAGEPVVRIHTCNTDLDCSWKVCLHDCWICKCINKFCQCPRTLTDHNELPN
ncbi:hypothetical protein VNO77_25968 [Canavalia gladiata]|uniref:Uncharacterized protein n=1 Tax=Canavalia gladiata TaxID=3824 RepID=A0AAN9Q306_CANGL